jgi:hypothetical protein
LYIFSKKSYAVGWLVGEPTQQTDSYFPTLSHHHCRHQHHYHHHHHLYLIYLNIRIIMVSPMQLIVGSIFAMGIVTLVVSGVKTIIKRRNERARGQLNMFYNTTCGGTVFRDFEKNKTYSSHTLARSQL